MADPWAARLATLDGAIDKHLAERLRVVPYAAGGEYSAALPDVERPAFEVQGRLHIGRGQDDLGGDGTRMWNSKLLTGDAMAEITASRLPEGFEFHKDDRIEALDRGLKFILEAADPHERGLVVLKLSRTS